MYRADVSFTWDDKFKVYILKGSTEAGILFQKKAANGVVSKFGKIIPASLIEHTYQAALNLGLCCERTDPETN